RCSTRESCSRGGKRTVEIGHLRSVSSQGGRVGGLIGGREVGRKNSETGLIQNWGCVQGAKNVENGHLEGLRTAEHQAKAGRARAHQRWHVARNIISLFCAYCSI